MRISDPKDLLKAINLSYLEKCLGYSPFDNGRPGSIKELTYDEPYGEECIRGSAEPVSTSSVTEEGSREFEIITGKVLALGDFIDTDAVSAAGGTETSILT